MPSSATITAFYTFVANTKARATQVNNNFDIFRGHCIPVAPLTATSADNTYDLGSSEYRWRTVYMGAARFGSTSASYMTIEADNTTTATDLLIKSLGTEVARIYAGGYYTFGANTQFYTVSTVTSTDVTNGSIAIRCHGRPIEIGMCPSTNISLTGFASQIDLQRSTSTATHLLYIELYRNTTTSLLSKREFRIPGGIDGSAFWTYSLGDLMTIDSNPGVTTNTYFFKAYKSSTATGSLYQLYEYRVYAKRTL